MPTILDHNGVPFRKGDLAKQQTAELQLLRRQFADHPAKGLTPQRLNRILLDAEQGDWTAQYELFNDMEDRCPHLLAEITKRKNALLAVGWELQPPRNATAAEAELTEKVREALYAIKNLDRLIFDLADAIGKGLAAIEYTWSTVEGQLLPGPFEHRPQSWLMVDPETRSQIRLRSLTALEGEELRPNNWITHQHRAKSGYVSAASLYRTLTWPFVFMTYSIRDLMELLEIWGLPIRVGKYPSNASDEEKRTLLRAVTEMGHRAAGIMPDEMDFQLVAASTATGHPFMSVIEWAERSISKAILGGTLTSQADGKTSTNALGEVHNEVRHDLLESDARQLEATLLQQLIAPLVWFNFGRFPINRLPFLQFNTKPKADITTWSTALKDLVDVGVEVPEAWAREKLNIPAPKAGEKVLRARSESATSSGPTGPTGPAPTGGATGLTGATGATGAAPSAKAKQAAAATLGALFGLPGVVALRVVEGEPDPDNPVDEYSRQLAAGGAATIEGWIVKLKAITERAASEGRDPQSLQEDFLAAFSDLDGEDLQSAMGLAMATADLAGQLAVKAAKTGPAKRGRGGPK